MKPQNEKHFLICKNPETLKELKNIFDNLNIDYGQKESQLILTPVKDLDLLMSLIGAYFLTTHKDLDFTIDDRHYFIMDKELILTKIES